MCLCYVCYDYVFVCVGVGIDLYTNLFSSHLLHAYCSSSFETGNTRYIVPDLKNQALYKEDIFFKRSNICSDKCWNNLVEIQGTSVIVYTHI